MSVSSLLVRKTIDTCAMIKAPRIIATLVRNRPEDITYGMDTLKRLGDTDSIGQIGNLANRNPAFAPYAIDLLKEIGLEKTAKLIAHLGRQHQQAAAPAIMALSTSIGLKTIKRIAYIGRVQPSCPRLALDTLLDVNDRLQKGEIFLQKAPLAQCVHGLTVRVMMPHALDRYIKNERHVTGRAGFGHRDENIDLEHLLERVDNSGLLKDGIKTIPLLMAWLSALKPEEAYSKQYNSFCGLAEMKTVSASTAPKISGPL